MSNVITSPTCRFRDTRPGLHKPIAWRDVCADCWTAMREDIRRFQQGGEPAFCHECGRSFAVEAATTPGEAVTMVYFFRGGEGMILCDACDAKYAAKLTDEITARANERLREIIQGVNAREAIREAPDTEKQNLYERFLGRLGHKRRV